MGMIHSLAFRLIALAIAATMATLGLIGWVQFDQIRNFERQSSAQMQAGQINETVSLLDELQSIERSLVLRKIKRPHVYLITGSTNLFLPPMFHMPLEHPLREQFGLMLSYLDPFQIVSAGLSPLEYFDADEHDEGQPILASFIVRLHDGSFVWVGLDEDFFEHKNRLSWILPAFGLVFPLILMIGFTLYWVLLPLRQLARAAEAIGQSLHQTPPLPQTKLREIAIASHALISMQTQIKAQFDRLMVALGALSHDLRTPLQRLALRAEMIEDEAVRSALHHDLSELNARVEDGLFYLRTRGQSPQTLTVHLPLRLRDWIARYPESGKKVSLQCLPKNLLEDKSAQAHLHWVSFTRALGNIIDNALIYGKSAEVKLIRETHEWMIVVTDEGPGIAPEDRERVFEPFVRLDPSRSAIAGDQAYISGSGMGLSIAKGVIEQLGGRIKLDNRPPQEGSGLIVTMTLPRTHRAKGEQS